VSVRPAWCSLLPAAAAAGNGVPKRLGTRPASLVAVTLTFLLTACAGPARPREDIPAVDILITGLLIENQTQAFVSAVRLLVPASGQFVSCGNIAPGANCATSFPEQHYSGNPVEISWSQSGQDWSTGELRLVPSADVAKAGQARVRVTITGPDLAGVELVTAP
jgi:hypothetical protein